MPLRVSALRALGAYMNVFSIESFMGELARSARADPVEFRLRHLQDERAREVIRLAAARFDWTGYQRRPGRGRGFAFARYNMAVPGDRLRGRSRPRIRRVRVARRGCRGQRRSGQSDGIRNQIEAHPPVELVVVRGQRSMPAGLPASIGPPIRSWAFATCPTPSTCM
jgi:hypothetical protein